MKWKELVKNYFTFTRKERIATLALLLVIVIIFFLPSLYQSRNATASTSLDTTWANAVKQLENRNAKNTNDEDAERVNAYQFDPSKNNSYKPGEKLFYFDPNTLTKEGWQDLGLKDKTIQTILNYRNKGGQFKKAEDLQRIYGFMQKDYERLAAFVRIETKNKQTEAENSANKVESFKTETAFVHSAKTPLSIDINSADTSAFIALPGIGSKLAARIVNFREKLGGFYSVDQVGETFGLPDSTFQKIKSFLHLKNTSVRKININTATVDELKAHPYIKYNIANPIIAYRNEHGLFSKTEDIQKLMVITEEIYKKVSPYLATQ